MAHKKPPARKRRSHKDDRSTLKIKLRGQDNVPLTMQDMCEATFEALRNLKQYEDGYRIKSAAIYLTMIDENGRTVRFNDANELVITAYKAAAEEHGL